MCTEVEEDCSHVFFKYPFAWVIWPSQRISCVDVKTEEAFEDYHTGGTYRREAKEGRLFPVLWATWPRRAMLVDGVVHDVEGFVSWWFSRA